MKTNKKTSLFAGALYKLNNFIQAYNGLLVVELMSDSLNRLLTKAPYINQDLHCIG